MSADKSASSCNDKVDSTADEKTEETEPPQFQTPQFQRPEGPPELLRCVTEFQDTDRARHEPYPEDMKARNTDRPIKFVRGSIMIAFIAHLIYSGSSDGLNTKIAQLTSVVLVSFHAHVFYTCYTAPNLHRIRVYSRRLKEWAPLSIPYRVVGYNRYPLESVSELCAAKGTLLAKSFNVLLVIFLLATAIYTCHCSVGTTKGMLEPHRAMVLMASMGAAFKGLFEYDMTDMVHRAMHLFGYVLSFGGVLGLSISRGFDVLSTVWLIGVLSFIGFYAASIFLFARESDDLRVVTRRSRILVAVENALSMILFFAFCRYIADGTDCGTY